LVPMFSVNSKVTLRSFNGAPSGPADIRPAENYWLLIGASGVVVDSTNAKGRVLVKFDASVQELGLACHNPSANSLYILESDLERTL
jgi:hypothetical protein